MHTIRASCMEISVNLRFNFFTKHPCSFILNNVNPSIFYLKLLYNISIANWFRVQSLKQVFIYLKVYFHNKKHADRIPVGKNTFFAFEGISFVAK